jgi:uncharacterized membrane protein YeiB
MSLEIPVLAPDSSQPTEAVQSAFATFASLFGAGFAIQLRRAERRGAPFVTLDLRPLAALFVFGFTAHALFGFNVPIGYACTPCRCCSCEIGRPGTC